MKKIILNVLILSISIALIAALSSCDNEDETLIINTGNDITTQINTFPKEPLNADELHSLIHMREEEKLAHDVYITLYNKWGVNVFTNIAASEQTHTTAIATLLIKYDIEDPASNRAVGHFSDTTLQKLYDQLITQGKETLLDGYKVGATIEDLDIFDLNNWIAKVDNQDITFVYQNLTKGSRNHMRSFYSQIINAGGTYSAQFISQAELDAIINSPKETGSW